MKLQKTKKEEKLNLLLKSLSKADMLSIADIIKILNCNRQSVYNYLNRLKENGYILNQQTIKNTSFYSLDKSSSPKILPYMPMTANILRKYSIIQELQENPTCKKELRKRFTVFSQYELENTIPDLDNKILLDVKRTSFYKLLHELSTDGEIVLKPDDKDKKYYLTGNSIPLILSIEDGELLDMCNELSNITPGIPYYEPLYSVYQKECLLLGMPDSDIFKNYFIYGRKYETYNEISSHLKKLNLYKYDYKNTVLQIKHISKNNVECNVAFAMGRIVYCLEKDTMYLLGKNMDSNQSTIIDICSITAIDSTNIPHNHYESAYFEYIFDTMFSISVDEPVDVIVEFDRVANVERKIRYLSAQRKFSKLDISENKLLYTDKISGLSDFASYLRQFGRSAYVKEPAILKEKMRFSVERTLKRYREVINNV